MFSADSGKQTAWQDEMKLELLWRGFEGIRPRLEKTLTEKLTKAKRQKVEQTLEYFRTFDAMASLCAVKYSGQWNDYWKTVQ